MKKAARERIAMRLEDDLGKINYALRRNCRELKQLARENENLKRQRPILQEMINDLKGKT